MFDGCIGLTHITIPNSVKYIGSGAFFNCIKLEKILFRGTHAEWVAIQKDEEWRDANCRYTIEYAPKRPLVDGKEQPAKADWNKRSLVMSATYRIKDGVLVKYYGLSSSAVIPDGVKRIGDDAFYYCKRLRKITIPGSVTSIGRSAFYECSRLTDVTIPNSVTSIDDWAFAYCTQLKEIIIPGSVTSIGDSAFSDCKNLTAVTISHGVRSIGKYAFATCSQLTAVTIPNSVTSIGDCAFLGSSMTEIAVPNSVTTIGRCALGSRGLRKIIFQGTPEQWNAIDKDPYWHSSVAYLQQDRNGHYHVSHNVPVEYVPQSNDSLKDFTSS